MKKLLTILLLGLAILFLSRELTAQTYNITNVAWTDQIDQDGDGYTRSRTMNITINASQNTTAILEIRAWLDGQAEALYGNTVSFAVFGGTYDYTVLIGTGSNIGGELTNGTYDFRVLLRTGINGTILAVRGPSDDNDLNNETFETAAQDQTPVPINGLLAYYPFNNNANDASGNGFNGIVTGATFSSDINGNPNCAISFDGIDDIVEIPNFTWTSTNTYTICAFVKISDLVQKRGILNIAEYYPRFEITNQSNLYGWPYLIYWFPGGNTSFPLRYASVGIDQWVHLAVINSNGNLKGYVNGVLYNQATYAIPQFVNGMMKIGLSGSNYMKGLIDEVRIYDRALTDSEIQAIYTFGSIPGISTPTIVTSVTSLPSFGNVTVFQNSTPQTYSVSGNNLTSDIIISAPNGFQISLNGTSWSSSLTLTQSGGSVPNTTINVRFSPTLVQPYSGNITHTSTGATTQNVAVSGTGISSGCSPNWIPVQNQQYSMSVIGQIIFPEGLTLNTNDLIGAFVGTECRGMAYVTSDNGRIYLSISSNQASGDTITFKAWRSSTCEELPVLETLVFQDNQIIGTYDQPFQFNAGFITQSLSFNPFYTWFSINVNPGSLSLNSLFSTPPVNSKIIGQTSFAVWTGTAWVGSLTQIDPKKMYVMYVEQPYDVEITGLPIDPLSNTISLGTGWNWTGYLPQTQLATSVALQNTSPYWVTNELIKSQTQFSIFSGGTWVGSLVTLNPGKGYKIQVTSNKTLTFPNNTLEKNTNKLPQSLVKQNDAPPIWIPVPNMQYSMNVIAKLRLDPNTYSNNINDLIGAFVVVGVDTQCRGVQSPDPNTGLVFLSIGSNFASGEVVTIKAYRSDCDMYKTLSDTFHFVDNRFIGLPDPYIFIGDSMCIIPVELTAFTASNIGSNIILEWTTATELNNMGFDIEKSIDQNTWTKIGFISGKGTTTEKSNYTFTDKNSASGLIYYRLKQIDFDGSFSYSPIVSVENTIPLDFSLSQNYPNPFNPSCTIEYALPKESFVTLSIYNVLGDKVDVLINERKIAGNYSIKLDATSLTSGVYFYRLQADNFVSVRKMLLLK